jgi:outer membrane protein TolC
MGLDIYLEALTKNKEDTKIQYSEDEILEIFNQNEIEGYEIEEEQEHLLLDKLQNDYGLAEIVMHRYNENDYYLAAVGLTYTLFDGNIVKSKKQKAKIDYLKTKNYFEYMKEGIQLEVKKNFLDLSTQNSTLKQKIKTQAMAEDILKETETMFANNLKFRTNMMYLLMQLENMLKVQADVIMSQYNQTITSGKLKLSIGKSLDR